VKRRRGIVLDVSPGAEVHIDDSARLGRGTRIHARGGTVRIGANATLGERCVLIAHAGIEIGEGAVLADEVVAIDFEPTHDDVELPLRLQPLRAEPIVVGAGARVGVAAALSPGTRIAPGATVLPRTVRA
jgi:acetyltransferase-like isoleucine patch superfamily enzyme